MKAYLADTFSDEEGPEAIEGKTVYLQGSKEDVCALAEFFANVATYLESHHTCHMHFRDHSDAWSRSDHIDITIDVGE